MGLRILYHNDPLLRKVSRQIGKNEDVLSIVDKLKDAIRYEDKVWTGTGLSICGIQIGIPWRIILIGRPLYWNNNLYHKSFNVMINPEILTKDKDIIEEWEGCLSIPHLECLLPRHKSLILKYNNLLGKTIEQKFEMTISRVIQHEIDHLDGILMTDKAIDSRKKREKK